MYILIPYYGLAQWNNVKGISETEEFHFGGSLMQQLLPSFSEFRHDKRACVSPIRH